jgi:hypothetical protein
LPEIRLKLVTGTITLIPGAEFLSLVEAGTGYMILKIFSPKKSAKNWRFLIQNKAILCKILIITLVFEKNANFLPKIVENRRKL